MEGIEEMGQSVSKYNEMAINFATEYGMKIVAAILIFFIGKMIAKSMSKLIFKVMSKYEVDETLTKFAQNGVYVGLMAVVIMAAVSSLGVDTTSFMAILGAAGLAIGLALKDTLSNVGAAVVILIFRPFKVGDFVDAGGAIGTVDEIGLFTTTISPLDNRKVIVPNSAITGGNITNFSSKPVRRVDHIIGIGYDDDLKLAKETLYALIEADGRTLADPAPLVAVAELGDSSVNFTMRAWVNSEDYWDVYFDLLEKAKLTLDEKGISIPYPQMDVHSK
ncbi:MAG: mechanosensitive ion channel [Campylobacterota bacterium]|nr:mechanosensitive ion channel [Campylobacterota bacterium]